MPKSELNSEQKRLIESDRWSFEDIIAFLPKQISLRKLDQELANALADDTHELSVHLTRQYTKATKKRGQVYYAWNKERRFFILMLSTMCRRNFLLEKTVGLPRRFRGFSLDQGWTLGFDIQLKISRGKKYRYDLDNDSLPFALYEDIKSSSSTEVSYIKDVDDNQSQYNNRRLSEGSLNLNLSSLLNQNIYWKLIEKNTLFHRKLIEDFWHQSQAFVEDEQSPLEFAKSLLRENQNSNIFTRKFSRYIVKCVNGYWFRVYHVEKKNHGKIKLQKTRYVPVKNYSTFGIAACLFHVSKNSNKIFNIIFDENGMNNAALQKLIPLDFNNNLKIAWDWVYSEYKQKRMKYESQLYEGVEIEEISFEHFQPPDDEVLCKYYLEKDFVKDENKGEYSCPECGYVDDRDTILPYPGEDKYLEEEIEIKKLSAESREKETLKNEKKKSWQMKLIDVKNEVLCTVSWNGKQRKLIDDGLAKDMKTLGQIKALRKMPENSDKTTRSEPERTKFEEYYSEFVTGEQDKY